MAAQDTSLKALALLLRIVAFVVTCVITFKIWDADYAVLAVLFFLFGSVLVDMAAKVVFFALALPIELTRSRRSIS